MRRLVTFGGLALIDDADATWRPLVQRRQLLLLALVARAGAAGVTRDRALALLWPERDETAARHLLEQALYAIRRALGRAALPAGSPLRLDPTAAACDVVAFESALAAGELEAGVALYAGPFLDGVHVADAPEFERWVAAERARLAERARSAMHALAARAEHAADAVGATRWWRAAAALDPLDATAAVGLVRALGAAGDVPAALRQAQLFAQLLRVELDVEPPPALGALVERLRSNPPTVEPRAAPALPAASAPVERRAPDAPASVGLRRPTRARPRRSVIAVAAAAALALAGSVAARRVLRGETGGGGAGSLASQVASQVASQLAAQGVAAFEQGDQAAAYRLLRTAVARDSALAVGWYYLARADRWLGRDSALVFMRRALAAAPRASRHDRLLVEAAWASMFDDPDRAAAARRFAREFPDDPAAAQLMGAALVAGGDFLAAVPYLRHAIASGGAELASGGPMCEACEAYEWLVGAYKFVDSLPAAERTAREWIGVQPRESNAWWNLAVVLVAVGRVDEGLAAYRRAQELPTGTDRSRRPIDPLSLAEIYVQAGWLDRAATLCAEVARDGPLDRRLEGEWYRAIVLRHAGRPGEAAELFVRMRRARLAAGGGAMVADVGAQALFEAGAYRDAAAVFDSMATHPPPGAPGSSVARNSAWMGTHAATALAAAGDTATLTARADSIERSGQRSGYGRDQRLHHYVRGLLLAARGNHEGAVASYRAAIYSPTAGFTRVNLELGRALLALGRPAEAVAALQSALRTGVTASNLYVTRTELHEALADAWSAAGRPDSARAHYAAVASAWRAAEPRFHARRERARILASGAAVRLARLTHPETRP